MVWAALLTILLVALPPLLIDLRRPPVLNPRERLAIDTAVATWRGLDQHTPAVGWRDRLVPIHEGRSVYDQPPGTTWLHVIALRTLDPNEATDRQIVARTRYASVVMALLAIAGVFWVGYAIGGIVPASLSALVIMACPAFLIYGRLATQDMPTLAFVVVAAAAALWAMRPHRRPPTRTRQGLGYGICGLALGMAVLCGGAGACPVAFVPIMLIGLLAPQRAAHAAGLFAAGALALLLIAPWVGLILGQDPDAWRVWIERVAPPGWEDFGEHIRLTGWRVALITLAVMPWSLWLVFAIAQPFSTSSIGWRSRMFIGWAWFITVSILLLVAPGHGDLFEVLPALPAAAVVIGQLFRRLVDLSSEGRHARLWRIGRWPTIVLCLALSVLLPLAMAMQEPLIDAGYLTQIVVDPMHWSYHVITGLILLGLAVTGARFAARHYPGKALLCWAVWTVALCAALASPIARGPLLQ